MTGPSHRSNADQYLTVRYQSGQKYGIHKPHHASNKNTSFYQLEGTVGLGQYIIGKFGCKNRFEIIVCEGPLVLEIGRLHFFITKTCPRREVLVFVGLGLISTVFRG